MTLIPPNQHQLANLPDHTPAQSSNRGGCQALAIRQARAGAADFVPHLRMEEVQQLAQTHYGWVTRITGKGSKVAEVAISPSLAARLQSYAYRQGVKPAERIFPISAARVWQIVDRAFLEAGIRKPDHVGTVHVLRHSGAIARLALTGNPKAVQDQLRHKEAKMTLRYLKTLSSLESLKIQQGVDFQW